MENERAEKDRGEKESRDKESRERIERVERESRDRSDRGERELGTPTVSELQVHQLDDTDKEVKIELKVGFRETSSKKLISTKIDFMYKLSTDSPEAIAEEIVNAFKIDPSYAIVISQIVREKVMEACRDLEIKYKNKLRVAQSGEIDDGNNNLSFEFMSIFKENLSKNSPEQQKHDIMLLQRALNHISGEKILIDGVFGTRTEHVVKKFQESIGAPVDGVVKKSIWDQIMLQDIRKTQSECIQRFVRMKRLNTCPGLRT